MKLLPLPLLLLACAPDSKGGESQGSLTTSTFSQQTGTNGLATIDIEVDSDTKAFLLTAQTSEYPAVEKILDPNGDAVLTWQNWYHSSESLTEAIFPWAHAVVVNWPIRSTDAALSPGTWQVVLGVMDYDYNYVGSANLDMVLQTKTDSKANAGTVKALVVYSEGTASDATVVAATESAIDVWHDIWAAYGLTLEVEYIDSGLDDAVPDPSSGSSEITAQSDRGNNKDVTVLIGERVSGVNGIYGIAGGIPGTLVSTAHSAVAISWLTLAGGDGVFSEEDIRLYGETLAHEVGHYAGLFHPVEDDFSYWDAIDDTEQCTSSSTCESSMGNNLMFPYPVCDWSSCLPQDQLTAGQTAVTHNYTGTL